MPITNITQWVKNEKRHSFYIDSVRLYDAIRVHSDGEYPESLIGKRRPAESVTIKNYRKEIHSPITKPYFSKVQTSLGKIRKSSDYNIHFDDDKVPAVIKEDETLKSYTTDNFPKFTSLDNWFWSICFKNLLADPNAIALIDVINPLKQDTEYFKPYPTIYNSDQILDYKEYEFYFLKSKEAYYYQEKKELKEGAVYFHVTTTTIERYEQINSKGDYSFTEFVHGLNYLPIVKLHGVSKKDNLVNTLFDSRIAGMLPEFDEAMREYSDLQAEIVQHIHSTLWALNARDCKTCKGMGFVKTKDNPAVECHVCKGTGTYPFNPFETLSLKAPEPGANMPPTPPAGFITKQIDIAKLQDQRVQDHIYRGLSAISFEFLMNTPLNQSGAAKEVDKSELNTFVYSMAEDCIRVIDNCFSIINDYRYSYIIPDMETREEMLPRIEIPTKYDIVTDQMISEDIKRMKDAKFNQKIIAAAEVDYVGKRFLTDDDLKELVLAMYDLDPLSGVSEDDITQQFTNSGISKVNYVIHCNIKQFVEMAMEEDDAFLELTMKEKRTKMEEYATAEIKKESGSNQVMNQLAAGLMQQKPIDNNAAANN
jgi:hypothetical protein